MKKIRKIFLLLIMLLAATKIFAERKFVSCQNMAVNGGEKPKWVFFLFDKHNEKKARKLLDIGANEKILYKKLEGANLDMTKSIAKQMIYQDAKFESDNEEDVINALHNEADFWILEEDEETKEEIYTYYTVYSIAQ